MKQFATTAGFGGHDVTHIGNTHSLMAALGIALCAATLPAGMATCAVALGNDGAVPEWVQLMPLGKFAANDGRAPWTLNNAAAVIAASKIPGLVDFDHGTQMRNDSAASGWIEELKPQGPAGEPGIWAKIDWTDAGKAALASKKFRFFSPTFLHNAAGVVTRIIGGSLVNNPALDTIPALASQQENALELSKLISMLGLPSTASADDVTTAIKSLCDNKTATAAQLIAIASAAGITATDAAKIGSDEITAICTKLKAPAAVGDQARQVATLSTQVADLTGRLNTALLAQDSKTAEETVEAAIKAGKLAPAMKAEALALCKSNPAGFDAMIAKAPVILSSGNLFIQAPAEGELTTDQLSICKQMGIKPEDYKKTLAGQKENA